MCMEVNNKISAEINKIETKNSFRTDQQEQINETRIWSSENINKIDKHFINKQNKKQRERERERERELHTNISNKHRCKNPQQNIRKVNPTIH